MRLSLAKCLGVHKAGLALPEDILYTQINGAISCRLTRSVTVMAEIQTFLRTAEAAVIMLCVFCHWYVMSVRLFLSRTDWCD